MQTYHGSCHCGAVSFSFCGSEIASALRCTCSICKRKGALLTHFVVSRCDTQLETNSEHLTTYQFGTNVAKHYFCNRCGIFTFVETRLNPGQFRFNLGCIDDLEQDTLPVDTFDGTSI